MIDNKYFQGSYKILPLSINADLSEMSLEQALIQHNFKLESEDKYTLVIGRDYISDLLRIKNGYNLFDITVEIQVGLVDEWYLVCEQTKTIIYSPGA